MQTEVQRSKTLPTDRRRSRVHGIVPTLPFETLTGTFESFLEIEDQDILFIPVIVNPLHHTNSTAFTVMSQHTTQWHTPDADRFVRMCVLGHGHAPAEDAPPPRSALLDGDYY